MGTDLYSLLASRSASIFRRISLLILLFITLTSQAETIIAYQSDWKYLDNGTTYNTNSWRLAGFNDSAWPSGPGPFAFGNYFYRTRLQRGPNNSTPNHKAFYFRKTVNITNAAAKNSYRVRAYFDDGIVIYVNGVEVSRKNMNANPDSLYTRSPGDSLTIDVKLNTSLFQEGNNIISAEVHQVGETSSDILFDLQLEADVTPISLFRYPYLQLPSYNQMTVRWYTNVTSTATVRYGTSPDLASYTEVSVATRDTMHSVLLKNLNPDTKYYYSVGYNSGNSFQLLQYNSAVNYFRTLPSPTDTSHPLRFWLLGDSGAGTYLNPRPFKVRNAYLAYLNSKNNPNVDGIVFLGDNSNTQDYEGTQLALDTTLFRFYNRPNDQQLLSHIPSWTVIGNHDYEPEPNYVHSDGKTYYVRKAYHKQTAASFSTFAYPDSAQIGGESTLNKKGYYSFNQGDIHFVVLNPPLIEIQNISDNWLTPNFGGYDILSKNSIALDYNFNTSIDNLPQVKWLIKDLSANTKKWTVVTFHLPPFTSIGHLPSELDLTRVREKLMPILEKPEYHVDAVIVSHSHAYLRAGMIRKKGNAARTTDSYQSGNNLGRYPASGPYIKSNSETAYSYILSGSAGRGFRDFVNDNGKIRFISDSGYNDSIRTTDSNVQHPSFFEPKLDNLTGDNTTSFYHTKGGSVELFFQENRLDVKFIRESDVSPNYIIADSFVVMKDVNKKTTITSQNGGDLVNLKASWIGDYRWYSSAQPTQLLASGGRELSMGPNSNSTFYVRDQNGYLADTFIVNVTNPRGTVVGDTVIPFHSEWLFPLSAGFSTKGVKLNEQCVVSWTFSAPAFEMPGKGIIGLGHTDEGFKLSNALIERVFVPAEKLWFRRSFILTGSTATYASFKLTLQRDKNLATRKSYTTSLQTILINGQEAVIQGTSSKDIAGGREEIVYTLSNAGFNYGVNYILVSYYLTPMLSGGFPVNPSLDPFTFDAQLVSTPATLAPPPASKQFKIAKTSVEAPQYCAGDSVRVQFTAVGNESGFPLVYEARLVTASGDVPLAEGVRSPIAAKLPGIMEAGKYRIKIVTKSAYLDQLESSEIQIKALPKATIAPAETATIWKGQPFLIGVKFEGEGPWSYVLSDNSSGNSTVAEKSIEVNPVNSQTYSLKTVSNSCGTGQATGSVQVVVKEPVLTVTNVSRITVASRTALCTGDSLSVAYTVVGPDDKMTYSVELSDQNGNFNTPVVLGNGNTSPIRTLLPGTIPEGDRYRIRVKALDSPLAYTQHNSDMIPIHKTATGSFVLDKETIINTEEVKIQFSFTGSLPVYYYLKYGADTLSGNTSQATLVRMLLIGQERVFSLDSVRNVCGYGTIAGKRMVTVSLVVGSEPPSSGIAVYPNPSSGLLLLKNKRSWKEPFQWSIYGVNGKLFQNGIQKASNTMFTEIDLHLLSPGLYILRLNEKGRKSSWKIVKE